MKITTKGRYGLTMMIALARHYGEGPISLKTIAYEQKISGHYLEQLAAPLRNQQLIKSIRGAHGGYLLTKDPAIIHVGEIIRILEGPIMFLEKMDNEEPAQKALWMRMRNAVKDVLDHTTLADLTHFDKQQNTENYMFYI